jgi:hypothetical protein
LSVRCLLWATVLSIVLWVGIVAFAVKASASCHTHRCWHRVSVRRHLDYAWAWVKRHPMPTCTYVGESSAPGDYSAPFGMRRYRARNLSSTAGGKYQMLDISAHAAGVPNYPGTHDAAQAPPLLQEKAARRLLAMQGIHAWARC